MRRRHPSARLAAALVVAAGIGTTGCWSEIKESSEAVTDSAAAAPGTGPGSTEGGVAQPGSSQGGPIPNATDTIGGRGTNSPTDTGAGRAAQPAGTNAGARDTTSGARPPR